MTAVLHCDEGSSGGGDGDCVGVCVLAYRDPWVVVFVVLYIQ